MEAGGRWEVQVVWDLHVCGIGVFWVQVDGNTWYSWVRMRCCHEWSFTVVNGLGGRHRGNSGLAYLGLGVVSRTSMTVDPTSAGLHDG